MRENVRTYAYISNSASVASHLLKPCVYNTLSYKRVINSGPRKLPHMSVRKIADFWASKWPHPCPDIADFGSQRADPCPGHCGFEVGPAKGPRFLAVVLLEAIEFQ
jgi:hypothetical protein